MSTACRCCCCPATSSPTAGPIRCCSRSRIFPTARSRRTTASGRSRAISTASPGPSRSSRRCQRAMAVLTDPAECGPVTLALCQDVQAEAFDYPESFFAERIWTAAPHPAGRGRARRGRGAPARGEEAADRRRRRRALCGGRGRARRLRRAPRHSRRARRRPASRASPSIIRSTMGAIGVTGTGAANALAEEADVVLAVGTRLQDFTTGSWALFKNPKRRIDRPQRAGLRRRQARRRSRSSPTPRAGLEDSRRGARRLARPTRPGRAARAKNAGAGASAAARYTAPTNADAALRRAGDRRRAARDRALRHRRLRGRRAAGRTAQALAGGRARRLPPRIRLFLHGLRDRRRPRRQDGASRPRGRRDGRRRLLPDDEFGDRHLGHARAAS